MGRSFREEKRLYTRKARQTLNACLDEFAPGEAETILSSLVKSKLEKILSMECLAECSNNEEHWSSRRQILSIMADM